MLGRATVSGLTSTSVGSERNASTRLVSPSRIGDDVLVRPARDAGASQQAAEEPASAARRGADEVRLVRRNRVRRPRCREHPPRVVLDVHLSIVGAAKVQDSVMQIRIARPTRDLERVAALYRLLDLPVIASFEDHDGYSGVVFGLPDSSRQLELVHQDGEPPSPTSEDQLVLYLGSAESVRRLSDRICAAGFEPRTASNPYWERNGAVCFVDPDGYWLILSPDAW